MNHDEAQPSAKPDAPQAGAKPEHASLSEVQRSLREEILSLMDSGENPARLQELLVAYESNQLRLIDNLQARQAEQSLYRLLERREYALTMLEIYRAEMDRRDLTFPEMVALDRVYEKHRSLLLKTLLGEREWLASRSRARARKSHGVH